MLKLELLLRRIRGFDAKRMMVYVRDVKKETKTPTPVIMADMLYCILRYNVGFYDYHISVLRTSTAQRREAHSSLCRITGA